VEPSPAVLPGAAGGAPVLETFWTLGAADRAALESALRLRDAAPGRVAVQAAARGPRRVGQALREVLSLGADRVRLVVQDSDDVTPERTALALAAALAPDGPFELVLGGDAPHREKRLAALVAEALGVPLAGEAAGVAVQAAGPDANVRLAGPSHAHPRERPLPAAVLVRAGTELRPFTVAGYLAGLQKGVEAVTAGRSLVLL
jgi:electron transfer flavoprotein alpha/beta subunit